MTRTNQKKPLSGCPLYLPHYQNQDWVFARLAVKIAYQLDDNNFLVQQPVGLLSHHAAPPQTLVNIPVSDIMTSRFHLQHPLLTTCKKSASSSDCKHATAGVMSGANGPSVAGIDVDVAFHQ